MGIFGAQRSFGWQTRHLTTPRYNKDQQPTAEVDGWSFHRTNPPPALLGRAPVMREWLEMRATERRISQVLADEPADVVHAHSPILAGIPALRAARRAGKPMVYEVRALWEDAAVDLGTSKGGGLRYRATRDMESWLLRRADAVVTLCDSMRDELASRGIPPERIAVVPNAVDLSLFGTTQPRDEGLAASLGLNGRTVLGFIGSFYHYEGLDYLLEALARLKDRLPGITALLVGGGPEAERLQAKAVDLALGDAVHFTGRVPHSEVHRYYGLIDLFVYPRRSMRLTELVTPLKPLEAMAQRRVVLASDVGGHRALVSDGQTGFLFKADDPAALAQRVLDVVGDPAAQDRARTAGRRFVETERTWEASAAAYKPVYERLVREGPRR